MKLRRVEVDGQTYVHFDDVIRFLDGMPDEDDAIGRYLQRVVEASTLPRTPPEGHRVRLRLVPDPEAVQDVSGA